MMNLHHLNSLQGDADEKKEDDHHPAKNHVHCRRGLLKKLIDHYSSTPIPEDEAAADAAPDMEPMNERSVTPSPKRHCLTTSEQQFLEELVQDGDLDSVEAASIRLTNLFPPEDDLHDDQQPHVTHSIAYATTSCIKIRRDSVLQQELFRLHETQKVAPSHFLHHMSLLHRNSILEDGDIDDATVANRAFLSAPTDEAAASKSMSNVSASSDGNEFKDVSSWVDGGVGVEVTEDSGIMPKSSDIKTPFRVLGTTADDVSCHPHVLSPPLMESLLAFLPETLTDYNFLLKYSLVRDGASLWTLLRNTRASRNCFLAIETVDGQVFGAFTSQTWLISQGWYGTKDAFLFKLRHSRLDIVPSILQQVSNETEIQVYPYRSGNASLQHCSKAGIMMGQGELLPVIEHGEHYGYGLYLDPSLERGTTSTSETFGNPCLVSSEMRGSTFEVSNIEVWSLTPHITVEEAERAELSSLFLEGGKYKNLKLMDIIVGGAI